MPVTGWGEGPDGGPAMPLTERLLRNRERGPGDTLEIALARSRAAEAREIRDEAAAAPDPDQRAAGLVARGVAPGMIFDLGQRLADVEAELAAEHEKMEKGERVGARVRGMLERGQIGGLDAARMLGGDFGDAQRAAQLERRAGRLRQQLADAQAMISPPQQRAPDGLEQSSRTAHDIFAELTRAKFEAAQARRPEPRPFGSVSRFAGAPAEHTGPDCWVCAEGRRTEAKDPGPYPPVITTGYQELAR